MNPSPLRYPGGKYKLYPYVAKLIEINDCTTYIEPFCGGAAIPLELLFHNNIKRVILNDYDYSIYCFWESVLTDTDAFSKQISIYNLEALDFIESVILKTRRSFTFFDPPYYNKGPVLYTNFYSHDDHQKLADAITHNLRNRKWIVTYDNSNEINKMYSKTKSIEFSLQYSLQS